MYHTHFRGTHYDIGFRYGSALRKNGKFILDNVPFPIGEEQFTFAAACRPLYETHFPEILQEIHGLADGQECPAEKLEAVLFCMYCMIPSCHCSHFAVRNGQRIIFGRNSDFLTCIEKLYMNCIYHFSGTSHSFIGNTTAFAEMEDGINEYGLAIGLTMVQSKVLKPGLNAGMILRMILEKCTNVQEAFMLLKKIPIASGQTFVLADQTGTIALAECNAERREIRPVKNIGKISGSQPLNKGSYFQGSHQQNGVNFFPSCQIPDGHQTATVHSSRNNFIRGLCHLLT